MPMDSALFFSPSHPDSATSAAHLSTIIIIFIVISLSLRPLRLNLIQEFHFMSFYHTARTNFKSNFDFVSSFG